MLWMSKPEFVIFFFLRASWEELQQLTKQREKRLQDAEAVHKCFWDLKEALSLTEVNMIYGSYSIFYKCM